MLWKVWQSGGASRWRVSYERGLPRLVKILITRNIICGHLWSNFVSTLCYLFGGICPCFLPSFTLDHVSYTWETNKGTWGNIQYNSIWAKLWIKGKWGLFQGCKGEEQTLQRLFLVFKCSNLKINLFNRPSVAGTVLQTPSLLIDWLREAIS